MSHRHRVKSEYAQSYSGPVSSRENRAAHGNVCKVQLCGCGAMRRINVNQQHEERGAWKDPENIYTTEGGERDERLRTTD